MVFVVAVGVVALPFELIYIFTSVFADIIRGFGPPIFLIGLISMVTALALVQRSERIEQGFRQSTPSLSAAGKHFFVGAVLLSLALTLGYAPVLFLDVFGLVMALALAFLSPLLLALYLEDLPSLLVSLVLVSPFITLVLGTYVSYALLAGGTLPPGLAGFSGFLSQPGTYIGLAATFSLGVVTLLLPFSIAGLPIGRSSSAQAISKSNPERTGRK